VTRDETFAVSGYTQKRKEPWNISPTLEMVLNGMEQAESRSADNFEGSTSKSWGNDPYAGGAICWFRPAEMAAKRGLSGYNGDVDSESI